MARKNPRPVPSERFAEYLPSIAYAIKMPDPLFLRVNLQTLRLVFGNVPKEEYDLVYSDHLFRVLKDGKRFVLVFSSKALPAIAPQLTQTSAFGLQERNIRYDHRFMQVVPLILSDLIAFVQKEIDPKLSARLRLAAEVPAGRADKTYFRERGKNQKSARALLYEAIYASSVFLANKSESLSLVLKFILSYLEVKEDWSQMMMDIERLASNGFYSIELIELAEQEEVI